ncbi:hypothetical protein CERSUDRAFT_100281 [Gelatoporia subvermispora B]|uniref:Uncharacterized protein n=1 Tax=Ceriporiopsis subvermispora (strain B) TaxID=914234 RepID=M2R034_CERS8|nr:hypothetical protein CERSUDRAFT_100281 [Gelatoporia subvermispora B]
MSQIHAMLLRDVTNVFTLTSAFSTPLFLLSLRQLADASANVISHSTFVRRGAPDMIQSQTSSLRFGSFVGNISESLDHNNENDDIDIAWDIDHTNQDDERSPDSARMSGSEGTSTSPISELSLGHAAEGSKQATEVPDIGPLAV